MILFENLDLWVDPVVRRGPEAMAVDEWLLETADIPVLRVYRWEGGWVSIGYFDKIGPVAEDFPGVEVVRRWTGGGIVDHREDWTYTLVVPRSERLANAKGAESYLRIHECILAALGPERVQVRLSRGGEETGAARCFENPVNHDLIGPDGRKIAGAGQRRTRSGLLHQGSITIREASDVAQEARAKRIASEFSRMWKLRDFAPVWGNLERKLEERYLNPSWTRRR